MNLKRFISGVSAFAVAVTAFAAVAVTANAKDYEANITSAKLIDVTYANSILTTTDNSSSGYSAVVADLSNLPYIADASIVTVEFDTKVPLINNKIPKLMYGVGDKSERGLTGNTSGADRYKKEGLVTYFGSEDAKTYKICNDNDKDRAKQFGNKDVHAKVTLDRKKHTYSVYLTPSGGGTAPQENIATNVGNITVIEAFTWGFTAYNLTFSNITVKYTVEVPTVETKEVTFEDPAPNDSVSARAFTSEITCNGDSFNNVIVKAGEQSQSLPLEVTVTKGSVMVGIILASKNISNIEKIVPKVTANYVDGE